MEAHDLRHRLVLSRWRRGLEAALPPLPAEERQLIPDFIRPGEGMLGRIMESGEAVFWASMDEAEWTMSPVSCRKARSQPCRWTPLPRPGAGLPGVRAEASPVRRVESDAAGHGGRGWGSRWRTPLLYLELQGHIAELEKANRELREPG